MATNDPPLDYAPPDPDGRRHRLMVQIAVVAGCALLLLVGMCGLTFRRAGTQINQMHCAGNMRSLGQALQLYAQDYHQYPADLQTLQAAQNIASGVFICPVSPDQSAAGAPIGAPGTCSYIYVGASLSRDSKPDAVVMLEDPANHSMDGGNVLFADGHVEWLALPYLIQIFNDLQQGINPPSATTTLTPRRAANLYDTQWKSRMPQLKSGTWGIPTTAPATQPSAPSLPGGSSGK